MSLYGKTGSLIKTWNGTSWEVLNKGIYNGSSTPNIPDYKYWLNGSILKEASNNTWVASTKTFSLTEDNTKDLWILTNKVIEVIGKPNWFFNNGDSVDDAYLATEGIYPIDTEVDTTTYDPTLYSHTSNDKLLLTVDTVNKVIGNYYSYSLIPKPTLEQATASVHSSINQLRDQKIFTNLAYTFPSGAGTIQLRNDTDLRNVTSLSLSALNLVVGGTPNATKVFMDAGNTLREMTATQMVAMGTFVEARIQTIYSDSWTHKHTNVAAIIADTELTDSEKVDALIAYDINSGWTA